MRTTTHMPRRVSLSVLLLAIVAAGVGGYLMGSRRLWQPPTKWMAPSVREIVDRMESPEDVSAWMAYRSKEIASLRKQRDSLRERHPDWDQPGRDLNSAYVALNEAERGLEAVDRHTIRNDDYGVRLAMHSVDRSLLEARNYIQRASR